MHTHTRTHTHTHTHTQINDIAAFKAAHAHTHMCTHTHTQINDIAALKAAGIEPKAVGWALVKVFAELMLIQGYIHGDPHPGNAMVRI